MDISKGEQFILSFWLSRRTIKFPAIIDNQPADGGRPLSLFESGAILLYLAEKTGKLLSGELRNAHIPAMALLAGRRTWAHAGAKSPFAHFAPQTIPYAIERFQVETQRLYGVLNQRLEKTPWLGGDHYSIADIACWPWVNTCMSDSVSIWRPIRR